MVDLTPKFTVTVVDRKKLARTLKALRAFVQAIDATGGIEYDHAGYPCPVGDYAWIDLGEAYLLACRALGREPLVANAPAEDEPAPTDIGRGTILGLPIETDLGEDE